MKLYRILLYKAYFDKGLQLTNYFKYLFGFAGIFSLIDAQQAIYIGIFYCLFCFLFGWWWYSYGLTDTENEIGNRFNPFQREVRKRLSHKRFK
jgi:Ca2+/Na+ antiporter